MTAYDIRLVAYSPFGLRLGVLPEPTKIDWTLSRYGWPTCSVSYAERSLRSGLLEARCEVALEVWDGTAWVEPDNCRMLRVGRSWDRLDKLRVRKYRLHGFGWLWTRLRVFDVTSQNPADGPIRPVRQFTDPDAGDIMVPTVNAAVARAFAGKTLPPDKTYTLDADSAGIPWDTTLDGLVEFAITQPISDLEQLLLETGMAEPAWTKRRYGLYNYGTYGRDLTAQPVPVVVRDAHGLTASPESQDDDDLAARVLVVGEGGRFLVRENAAADLEYGSLEAATSSAGLSDLGALNRAGRALERLGETEREQLTREGRADDTGPLPLRDFRVGDKVRLQRGNDLGSARFVDRNCVEINVTRTMGKGVTWHAKFSDRHEDRLARAVRMATRLAAGTTPGVGGQAAPPGSDIRSPQAPTNVQVVTTSYPHASGETRGRQSITWDPVLYAVNPDNPADPIGLFGYEIGEKRFGVVAQIAWVGKGQLSWERDDVGPGARELSVRAVSKQKFRSAWSADVDGAVVEDAEDGLTGTGLIVDAPHRNAAIRGRRASHAGTGFTYTPVSGTQSATFASTTAVHDYGVGTGTTAPQWTKSGRKYCQPGEKINVRFNARLAAAGTGTARARVRFWDKAGAQVGGAMIAATSAALTTATSSAVGTVEAPANAATFAVETLAPTLGAGSTVYINDVQASRQAKSEHVEERAIVSGKIGLQALIEELFADRQITGVHIKVSTIDTDNIKANAITTNLLAADSVVAGKIAANAITTDKLAANSVVAGKIAAGQITTAHLQAGAVTTGILAAGAVTADKIQANSISATQLTSTAINGFTISGATLTSAFIGAVGTTTVLLSVTSAATFGGPVQMNGNLTVDGTFSNPSTAGSKTAVRPIGLEDGLRFLDAADPVTYRHPVYWRSKERRYADESDPKGRRTRWQKPDQRRYASLRAEPIRDAGLDEACAFDETGELSGLAIEAQVPYLIPVIKDLVATVAELRAEIEALKA